MISISDPPITTILIVCIAVVGGVALFLLLTAIFYRCSRVRKESRGGGEEQEEKYQQDAWFLSMSTPATYRYMNDPRSKDKIRIPPQTTHIHLIILVHGWNGRPCSLGYMKDALEQQASATLTSDETIQDNIPFFIIHAATANQGKTSDGVAAGGSRLAVEVDEIIHEIENQLIQQRQQRPDDETVKDNQQQQQVILSLSFVGYSLGGLYAHYALSKISSMMLPQKQQQDSSTIIMLNNHHDGTAAATATRTSSSSSNQSGLLLLIVEPAIFCTACSPHLGLADELLYIAFLPRWLQFVIANVVFKKTGQDLFRFTNLLEELIMEPVYRNVLHSFQQRITYVNTYATDFQVPTQTAAFLDAQNDTIHHRVVEKPVFASDATIATTTGTNASGMIALVVETKKIQQQQQEQYRHTSHQQWSDDDSMSSFNTTSSYKTTTATLAQEMDAMGWIKVFCDTRRALKSIPRCCFINSINKTCASNSAMKVKWEEDLELNDNTAKSNMNEEKTCYASSELLSMYNNSYSKDNHLYFPAGHLVLVAETKTVGELKLTIKGRPIADELARRLVQGILRNARNEKKVY